MTDRPSIESLRDICMVNLCSEDEAAMNAALTELATLRESACRWYKADGTFEVLDPEEVIRRRKEAAASLAALRAENERLRLIETGARDSEALVAHLRAENEALRKANAEYLCYCQPEVHADGVTDPAVTCPRCALRAENARLVAERDALKQWHDQHEEREAASCPEDVGCIEFIGYLKDSLTAERARADALAARVEIWRAFLNSTPVADLSARDARIRREEREAAAVKVDELAALVRLLVHSIRKHSPDNETARRAMDYLKRHELQGSPLRGLSPAPDAAKPNNQQDQP